MNLLFLVLAGLLAADGGDVSGVVLGEYREVVVVPDSGGQMVAVAVRFPAGSAEDPIGQEGAAFALGRLLEVEAGAALAPLGARISVDVRPDEFLVTITSRADRWREAAEIWIAHLHDGALSAAAFEQVQSHALEQLRFEEGAPVRGFERERATLLRGASHRAARPVGGSTSSVGSLTFGELEGFRSDHLVRSAATVAVVGPVDEGEVSAVLPGPLRKVALDGRWIDPEPEAESRPEPVIPENGNDDGVEGDSERVEETSAPRTAAEHPPAPRMALFRSSEAGAMGLPTTPAGPPAWSQGDRTVVDRDLTSTWIAVAFPFPLGTSPVLLEFLAHLALEELTPSPPDPGLYEAEVSVEWVSRAPVLLVSASVDPRITTRWEDRLVGVMETLEVGAPTGAFFELTRRRFRSGLFLELSVPEARARWVTRQSVLEGGAVSSLEREVWSFDPEGVSEAAATAGPPRVLLFGPRQMMDR